MKTKTIGTIVLIASTLAVAHGLYKLYNLPDGSSFNFMNQSEIGLGGIGIIVGGFMTMTVKQF